MKLYVVVIDRVDAEPDWLFLTSKDYPTDEEVREAIKEQQVLTDSEFDNWINEFWVESVYATGYKIKLIKE